MRLILKIIFLLLLTYASRAQSNLKIGELALPIAVEEAAIHLLESSDVELALPEAMDTTSFINPENSGLVTTIKTRSKQKRKVLLKEASAEIKKSDLLVNPLFTVSYQNRTYVAYKVYLYFYNGEEYMGVGINDDLEIQQGAYYPLHYHQNLTLVNLKSLLQEHLQDAEEVIISSLELVSDKEVLRLKGDFKLKLK